MLLFATEVAQLLNLGKGRTAVRRVHRLAERLDFPDEVRCGAWRKWDRDDVIQWAQDQGYWDPVTGKIQMPNGQTAHPCPCCGGWVRGKPA